MSPMRFTCALGVLQARNQRRQELARAQRGVPFFDSVDSLVAQVESFSHHLVDGAHDHHRLRSRNAKTRPLTLPDSGFYNIG